MTSSSRTTLLRAFKSAKGQTLSCLASMLPQNVLTVPLMQRFTDLLDYNVPTGKLFRAHSFLDAYNCLNKGSSHTQMESEKLNRLAWALEYLQSFLLIVDDIMDKGDRRRGKICWYKMPYIGLSAVNDAFLLENCLNEFLKADFFSEPHLYLSLLDAFQEAKMKTILGQAMDMAPKSVDECSLKLYKDIVQFKTSHYSFYLPVQLALIASGCYQNIDVRLKTLELCYHIGYYYQAQDDYLDCFGETDMTGKSTRDIQEGKCTWLLVTAVPHLSTSQHCRLRKIYGTNNDKLGSEVKTIYEEINLAEHFKDFEVEQHHSLQKIISQYPLHPLRGFYSDLVRKISFRVK